jgi:hypothetical protein
MFVTHGETACCINSPSTTNKQPLAGITGLCGALLFFAGDMLLYGHLGSARDFHEGMLTTVRNISLARLYTGGLVAPLRHASAS